LTAVLNVSHHRQRPQTPMHHPTDHPNGPTPSHENAQARKRASAADSTLRVPFLPSAWAKPNHRCQGGPATGIRPRKPATLGAIRILPTRLVVTRVLLDSCGYLWQVDGRKGTRNPPLRGQPSGEDRPSTEAVRRGPPPTEAVRQGHPSKNPQRTTAGQTQNHLKPSIGHRDPKNFSLGSRPLAGKRQ
jgi:hypothetical protein